MDEEKPCITCRVCLQQCNFENEKCKFLPLFDKSNSTLIVLQIGSIANVDIHEGDGLPDRICPECLLELETAVRFKKKCEISNAILQNKKEFNTGALPYIKEEVQKEFEDLHDVEFEDIQFHALNYPPQAALAPVKSEESEEDPVFNRQKKIRLSDLKLECHDCGGLFPSKCKLRVHWKRMHKPKLICVSCKRIFKSYKAYHVHQKKQSASCKAVSQSRIEGEGKTRVFYCKTCEFKSRRPKDIQTHLITHTGDRPFKCNMCPKTFKQQGQMGDHIEMTHNIYRHEYTCQHCGKYLKGRHKFYSHMRIHKNTGGQCNICNKQFATKVYLATHMLRHAETKHCACEYCAATFYTRSELINHIRQIHKKSNKYACDICGYKATRNYIIKRHKLKHTDTNIPCLVCGMFLEDEQLFKLHEKRHLERPFSCPHCDLNFHAKKNLYKHVRLKHELLAGKALRDVFVKKESNIDVSGTSTKV